jgi:hypothetical protein
MRLGKHERDELELAQRAMNNIEQQTLISAEDLTESLSSWFWNDTVQAYQGEGFERVYLHMPFALIYLAEAKLHELSAASETQSTAIPVIPMPRLFPATKYATT